MMTVSNKHGRKIRAMVLNTPVDRCRGVIQCALPSCEAYMAIVEPGTQRDSGNVEDQTHKEQIAWFLEHHECRALEKKTKTPPKKGRVS